MKIILASKSGVRKKILDKYKISSDVKVSNVDEDQIKESLLKQQATPLVISKNLAEIKSVKVSNKNPDRYVLGADSVISLNDEIINKPNSREEAFAILKKLNNSKHFLISSVCISKNSAMIWNYTDISELKMKNLTENQLKKWGCKYHKLSVGEKPAWSSNDGKNGHHTVAVNLVSSVGAGLGSHC